MNKALLGDVADTIMGQAPPSDQCNKEGRGTIFVKAGEFTDYRLLIREWTTKPLKLARPNDVLVCVVGATAGKISHSINCAIGRSVAAVRPDENRLHTEYLFHFMKTQVHALRGLSQGLAQGVITREMLEAIEFPLPSLDEQRRLAAILGQADDLRRKRRMALEQATTFSKRLFASMFDNPQVNSHGFDTRSFGSIVTNHDNMRVPIKSSDRFARKGIFPYYGASGVIDYIDDYLFEGEKLLIGEDGANLLTRNTPIAFRAQGCFWVNNHAHVVADSGMANLCYLENHFDWIDLSPYVSGTAQPKLTRSSLDRLLFLLPPRDLQDSFATRVAEIDKLKASHRAHLFKLDTLFASLQHRAFHGEL